MYTHHHHLGLGARVGQKSPKLTGKSWSKWKTESVPGTKAEKSKRLKEEPEEEDLRQQLA